MIRLTTRGSGLLIAGLVLLVAAAVTGLPALAWPGGLLLGLVASCAVLAWFSARGHRMQRRLLPDRLAAGSPVRVSLDLERDSIGVGAWSVVEEAVPPQLTGAPALAVPSRWGRLRPGHHHQRFSDRTGLQRLRAQPHTGGHCHRGAGIRFPGHQCR